VVPRPEYAYYFCNNRLAEIETAEDTRNPRTHPKKQIDQIVSSIQHFGYIDPVLADENLKIIGGHARAEAAERVGLSRIPVIVISGLSETEKRALALADNRIAEHGGWHRSELASELSELGPLLAEAGLTIDLTGFEPAEIDSLLGDLVDPELDPADEVPSPKGTATSKIGDLWELGPHRLLCGDAQSATDVRRLMGNALAAMVITDPSTTYRSEKFRAAAESSMGTLRKAPVKCHRQSSPGSCASCSRLRPNIPSTALSTSCSWIGAT
jgi:hypothetical protein